MTIRTTLSGIAVAALAGLATLTMTQSAGAQEVTLRLAHWIPPSIAPASKGVTPWAEAVEKASNGRIKIQIFPAQQLGKAPDHYDMAKNGVADLSWVNPGYTAGRFPIYALTEMPFMSDNAPRGAKAIHEWYAEYGAAREMGDVKVCFAHSHAPGALHTKVKVTSPEQVKGLIVRPAHATMARFINQIGGAVVQVPAPSVNEALSKGTAEAVTFPWGAMYDFKLTELVPQHMDMPFYLSAQVMVMNKASYNKLSAANKAVIDAHCTPEWSQKVTAGWAGDDAAAKERLKKDSSQVFNTPSRAEIAKWRKAAEPVLADWKATVNKAGHDADKILAGYIKALEANNARY